jgi:uncharacterized protein (DUF952 family)
MAIVYHITTASAWKAAQERGHYEDPSLYTEGFIHLSEESQVAGVLERYYSDQKGLVKVVVDTEKLTHPLRYELAPSVNEEFPHLYGPLNLDAVVEVEKLNDL